jgi:hypothetical protein
MSGEISEALKRLAAEHEHATTQKERDRLTREIARISYSQEADRAKSRRNSRQGAFDAAMLSLDAHMETFDDPSKIATFSDGGKGAESIRNGGVELPDDVLEEALKPLSKRDKAFVCDVLDGKGWRELELGKRGFNKRLAKICSLLGSHPLQKSSHKT